MKLLALLFLLLQLQYLSIYAHFEGCDERIELTNKYPSFIDSPYFPIFYPTNSSCRYHITAPLDYSIILSCQINIPSDNKCTTQKIYVDQDGDDKLRDAKYFCGSKPIKLTSAFRSLTLAYISFGNHRGSFNCTLKVKPQKCECGLSPASRIVNGKEAKTNEFPSMATLRDTASSEQFLCGASIVSHYHLLSVAHCTKMVSKAQNVIAIVGTNDLANPTNSKYYAEYNIQDIYVHEQYQGEPYMVNDIAVFVTSQVIEWSRGVGPICLPPPTTSDSFTHVTVSVIGWGTTFFAGPTSSKLMKAELMTVSNSECQKEIQDINSGHICTYDFNGQGSDSCQYDSGGPVIRRLSRQYLVGITSFGKNCGGGAYPLGVNTRITYYINWIRQKINSSNCAVTTI